MKEIKFAVTSNKNDNRKMIIQAKSWAEELQVPYAPRYENGSLDAMLEDFQLDALLIASKKGPQIYTKEGMLFYHPGLGKVRWQRVMHALLASCAVGEAGKVVGLEASLPLWFLTSRGVQAYRGTIPKLARDLHRVEIIHGEASAYLQSLPEDSFDAVYFDPMFRQPVRSSSEMTPLRPLAYGEPLRPETVELALKAAPRVVIKERGLDFLKSVRRPEKSAPELTI